MPHRSWVIVGSLALAALAGCSAAGAPAASPPAHRTTVPTPDLCEAIGTPAVRAALHSRSARCATSGGPGGFTARFTGTATVAGRRHPATLTISYQSRFDAAGTDRWATVGRPQGDRVSLFGVGDDAVFEPKAAPRPQLVTVKDDLIVAVTLRVSGAPVPQDKLPDHLLEVAKQAVAAANSPP